MTFDLVLRGGRVIDPAQAIDRVLDVAFSNGKVAALGENLGDDSRHVKDVTGNIVTPGLIDLHTHVYWGGTSLGVDPLPLARGGCTTLVDTGSAGPGNYSGFLEHVIKPSPVRIIAYLNVSFAGIYGFSKRIMVGRVAIYASWRPSMPWRWRRPTVTRLRESRSASASTHPETPDWCHSKLPGRWPNALACR